jgi:hypothetical protein
MKPGYYLVRPDGERFYISPRVSESALQRVCDRALSDRIGWDYWIDYCNGLDVTGRPAWSNIDHVDSFI